MAKITQHSVDSDMREYAKTPAELEEVKSQLAQIATYETAKKYGFKADYVGTPLYDGNDGSRIICTDNTAAFTALLDDCITKKNLTVYFPAGHYGIKTGMINKDLTGCNLTIIGDGKGLTVIDFVKEDSTHLADDYVDDNESNYIAWINNAKNISFKDMTFKATTKRDLGVFKTYSGAVWGFVLDTFNKLILDNVEISNFAYRGISTRRTGRSGTTTMNGRIDVKGCYFHDNTGSGLWMKDVSDVYIEGGEYCYNGVKGDFQSGYAFTANNFVENLVVKNGYFHNNYVNSIDAHGCVNILVQGCTFTDNIRRDISSHAWGTYRTDGKVSILDCNITKGLTSEGETFMRDVFTTAQSRGGNNLNFARAEAINASCDDGLGGFTDKLKEVIFQNVNILCFYNGGDVVPNVPTTPVLVRGSNITTLTIDKCNWNYQKWSGGTPTDGMISALSASQLCAGTYKFNNFKFEFLADVYASGIGKRGALIQFNNSPTTKSLTMQNCNFKVNNAYLAGNSGSSGDGTVSPQFFTGSYRKFDNCVFEFTTTPPAGLTDDRINIGTTQGTYVTRNKIIRIGDTVELLAPSGYHTYSQKYTALDFNGQTIASFNPIAYLVLDDTSYFTVTIKATGQNWNGDDTLVFNNTSTSFSTPYNLITDGTKITVTAGQKFTDTDGRPKVRYQLGTKVTTQNRLELEITVKGMYFSYGLEKVVFGAY
jgi:Pectate lyase superfamily protein